MSVRMRLCAGRHIMTASAYLIYWLVWVVFRWDRHADAVVPDRGWKATEASAAWSAEVAKGM